jgi:hypothetical protein
LWLWKWQEPKSFYRHFLAEVRHREWELHHLSTLPHPKEKEINEKKKNETPTPSSALAKKGVSRGQEARECNPFFK